MIFKKGGETKKKEKRTIAVVWDRDKGS